MNVYPISTFAEGSRYSTGFETFQPSAELSAILRFLPITRLYEALPMQSSG